MRVQILLAISLKVRTNPADCVSVEDTGRGGGEGVRMGGRRDDSKDTDR